MLSTGEPHAGGPHIPWVPVGQKLALSNKGNNSRQEHSVANLEIGFTAERHRFTDNADDFLPFRRGLLQERWIEIIQLRRYQTRCRNDTKRRVF